MASVPASDTELSYKTSKFKRRPSETIMVVMLAATFLLSLCLIIGSIVGIAHPQPWGEVPIFTLAAGLVMFGYSIWYGRRFWQEDHTQYTLAFQSDRITLLITEPDGRNLVTQMPFDQMDFVEHVLTRDREQFIFHGKDKRIIQAPLWSMDHDAQPGLELLRRHHIQIVEM